MGDGEGRERGAGAGVGAADGEVLEKVDALRPRDRTIVVVTADHGECFENGIYFEHSECLLEGGIRVPLIVRYPQQFGAGLRVCI